jgi:hypothetical protein
VATAPVVGTEALMASKNKGGRNVKTPASKNLKEKRAAKKAKKQGGDKKGFVS